MCVDTEMIGIWLDELFTNEIEEIEGTIENERLWALGCDEEPNPHIQNIANHEEYLSILRELKEEAMRTTKTRPVPPTMSSKPTSLGTSRPLRAMNFWVWPKS